MTEWGLFLNLLKPTFSLILFAENCNMEGDFLWPVWDTTCCFIETESSYQVTDAEIILVNF